MSPEAGEKDLTEADSEVLNIAQTFRNAGLGAVVSAGEAAEPGAQNSPAGSSPQPVAPLTAMTLTRPFARPQARLRHVNHRLVLTLTGRPKEAEEQVRYLGRRGHSHKMRVLRTLHGFFTNLTLPTSGIAEISVRYIDPYDVERASPWMTLRLPVAGSTARKARRGR